MLVHVLGDFRRRRDKGKAGGGGDDVESAQNAVEILHKLSYAFATSSSSAAAEGQPQPQEEAGRLEAARVRDLLVGGAADAAAELTALLRERASGAHCLSAEAARSAARLLGRLVPPTRTPSSLTLTEDRYSDGSAGLAGLWGRHVVLSYFPADKVRGGQGFAIENIYIYMYIYIIYIYNIYI